MPLPNNGSDPETTDGISAVYKIEGEYLLIDPSHSKYIVLPHDNALACSHPALNFCEIQSPYYPTADENIDCMAALFLDNKEVIDRACQIEIRTKEHFPKGFHVTEGVWVIVTTESVRFTIVCNEGGQPRSTSTTIREPIGILKLGLGCSAVSAKLSIPATFRRTSSYLHRVEVIEVLDKNLSLRDIWKPLKDAYPDFSVQKFPEPLQNLDRLPMERLINEIDFAEDDTVVPFQLPWWSLVLIGMVASIAIFLAIKYRVFLYNFLKKINTLKKNPPIPKSPAPTPAIELPARTEPSKPKVPGNEEGQVLFPTLNLGVR